MARTPPRTPPRTRTQLQWTIKSRELTPELRALVARAAEMQGMPVGTFVAHTLRERSQQIVKGEAAAAGVPMVLPPRLAEIEQQLAELSSAVKALSDRRWWRLGRRG